MQNQELDKKRRFLSPESSAKNASDRYQQYVSMQKQKKQEQRKGFAAVMKGILNKQVCKNYHYLTNFYQSWKNKWRKLKGFVTQRKHKYKSTGKQEIRDAIFSAVLALYAGENGQLVQLDDLCDKFPNEVQFYIPQMCTYLFHFSVGSDQTVDEI